jgi:deoxyribodipyrimidine photo-lyase
MATNGERRVRTDTPLRSDTVVVLFNRDLRVHDHPALAEACRQAGTVVPLFVLDPVLTGWPLASSNRLAFLLESLCDLRRSLLGRGGQLYLRRGDPTAEALKLATTVGASAVFASADVSRYARNRQQSLARACDRARMRLVTFPGATVVPPEDLAPSGGDHYRVFTPYWLKWRSTRWRSPQGAPRRVPVPDGLSPGSVPELATLTGKPQSPQRALGGEARGRRVARRWFRGHLAGYSDGRDDLPGDRTSRLSPYLHFGCLSPAQLAELVVGAPGGESFLRQLCWRDFHHQVLAAFPQLPRQDYRPHRRQREHDLSALEAWQQGLTGIPIVDAGMRQLLREGWMANRARLLVASCLTKNLSLDWRHGAEHFAGWLVDADVANNSGNWQWVAGTGNDTRPNRRFNLLRQAHRYDPAGNYVRRHIPELASVPGAAVHQPWRLSDNQRGLLEYPPPIIDLHPSGSR